MPMETYLGTWQTAPSDGFWNGQNISDSENMIKSAIRYGITGFDTAQSYGKGQAEQTLGKILSRYPDKCFKVDTKIMPSSKDMFDILKTSLSRLKVNNINRLYLHWPRTGFDNPGFLKGMAALRKSGSVKKTGICNIPLEGLKKLVSSGVSVDCYQRPVSLLWNRELNEVRSFCKENSIELIGYSPLGMGLLGGKYRNREDLPDARRNLFCYDSVCHDVFLKLLDYLGLVAAEMNVSMADVALGWVARSGCDVVLLGARNSSQLEKNLKGLLLKLSPLQLDNLTGLATELSERSALICDNIFSYNW